MTCPPSRSLSCYKTLRVSRMQPKKDRSWSTRTATQSNHCLRRSSCSCSKYSKRGCFNSSSSNSSCSNSSKWPTQGKAARSMMLSTFATSSLTVYQRPSKTWPTWHQVPQVHIFQARNLTVDLQYATKGQLQRSLRLSSRRSRLMNALQSRGGSLLHS